MLTKPAFMDIIHAIESPSRALYGNERKRWEVQYDLYAAGVREEAEGGFIKPSTTMICEGEDSLVTPFESITQLIERFNRLEGGHSG